MGRDSLLALGWRFRVIDSVLGIVNQCWIHNGFWPSLILHSNEYRQGIIVAAVKHGEDQWLCVTVTTKLWLQQ